MWKSILAVFVAIILLAIFAKRDDGSVMVHFYDQNIREKKLECLSYTLFPQNSAMEKRLKKLYSFKETCSYRLDITYKDGIHCNSAQNAARQAVGDFPNAYMKIELRRGLDLLYSYYRDLKNPATADDLEEGFERVSSDLKLSGTK
jgi:hypothetical protein